MSKNNGDGRILERAARALDFLGDSGIFPLTAGTYLLGLDRNGRQDYVTAFNSIRRVLGFKRILVASQSADVRDQMADYLRGQHRKTQVRTTDDLWELRRSVEKNARDQSYDLFILDPWTDDPETVPWESRDIVEGWIRNSGYYGAYGATRSKYLGRLDDMSAARQYLYTRHFASFDDLPPEIIGGLVFAEDLVELTRFDTSCHPNRDRLPLVYATDHTPLVELAATKELPAKSGVIDFSGGFDDLKLHLAPGSLNGPHDTTANILAKYFRDPALRTAASTALFFGASGLPDTAAAQEPPAAKIDIDEKTHGAEFEFTLTPDGVEPRIEIFESADGERRDIFAGEGLDGFDLGRAGFAIPVGIGDYRGELDIFGERNMTDPGLRNYGGGINLDGWVGRLRFGLVAEFTREDVRRMVSYRNRWLRALDNRLAGHQSRLERAWQYVDSEHFPELAEQLGFLDPSGIAGTRDRLEELAGMSGQERDVEVVETDRSALFGLRLGTQIDHNGALSEPNIGIYNHDGRWIFNPVYFLRFGEGQRSFFGTGFLLGENPYEMNFALGGYSEIPGEGWNWRVLGSTDFDRSYKISGMLLWKPHARRLFIEGPVDFYDGGSNDFGIITNPLDFQTPELYEFGASQFALRAGYEHDRASASGSGRDKLYVESSVHPLSLYEVLSGAYVDDSHDPFGLLRNSHVGLRWEHERTGGESSNVYIIRAGTGLNLDKRTLLEFHVIGKYGDGGEGYGAFLRFRVPLGK